MLSLPRPSACFPLVTQWNLFTSALQAPGSAVPQLGLTPCPGHELWSSQAGFFSCVGQSLCLLRSCCCPRATCCSQPSTTGREVTLCVLWLPTCQGQKPGGLLEIRPQEDRGHLHPWSSFPHSPPGLWPSVLPSRSPSWLPSPGDSAYPGLYFLHGLLQPLLGN